MSMNDMSMERIVRPFERPLLGRPPLRTVPVQPPEEAVLEWSARVQKEATGGGSRMNVKLWNCEDLDLVGPLVGKMLAQSIPFSGMGCDEEDYVEVTRDVKEERVENEQDPNQYVDVERVEKVRFKLPKALQDLMQVEEVGYKLKHSEDE